MYYHHLYYTGTIWNYIVRILVHEGTCNYLFILSSDVQTGYKHLNLQLHNWHNIQVIIEVLLGEEVNYTVHINAKVHSHAEHCLRTCNKNHYYSRTITSLKELADLDNKKLFKDELKGVILTNWILDPRSCPNTYWSVITGCSSVLQITTVTLLNPSAQYINISLPSGCLDCGKYLGKLRTRLRLAIWEYWNYSPTSSPFT